MKISIRALVSLAAIVVLSLTMARTVRPQPRAMIQDGFASVNGVKLHYLTAGKGEPVILLKEAPKQVIPQLVVFINKSQ
jgi:hypothetical protein